MRASALLLATSLLLSHASAQTQNTVWFQDNSPAAGGGNAFPFGSDGVRYQCIVPNAAIGSPVVIQDLFVAGRTNDQQVVYGDIEIRMGITPLAAPVSTWASNNPNPTTVYRGPMRIVFKNGVWRGIGLPQPYVYLPRGPQDNLCIEVITWNVIDTGGGTRPNFYFPLSGTAASPGGAISRAFLINWVQGGGTNNPTPPNVSNSDGCKLGVLLSDGNMVVVGTSCQGSAANFPTIDSVPGTWPRTSTVFNVLLTNGKPLSPALLTLGNSETSWNGVPLPLDLAAIGAPACFVWNNFLINLPAPVDASGSATMGLPITPNLFGVRVRASWVDLDAGANSAGITTSNYAKLIIGT